jgi:hypothetical protein
MEGYLNKKSRGERTLLALHAWAQRWFVLEGITLLYYETFDADLEIAIKKRGTISLKDAVVKKADVQGHCHCFVIKHPDRHELVLEAESEVLREGGLLSV